MEDQHKHLDLGGLSTLTTLSTADLMSVESLTSSCMARAWPPANSISLCTVFIVESDEFGSGGNEDSADGSDVVFAAIATVAVT